MLTSFIIHYLDGQARNKFGEHLSEMLLYRASEATTFVNTCRLPITNPSNFLEAPWSMRSLPHLMPVGATTCRHS
jgi:hypothetical protein